MNWRRWWPLLIPLVWLLVPLFYVGIVWMSLNKREWSDV